MKKQTKLIAGLGALALGGLLVATQVTGNSEDLQGRFNLQQSVSNQKESQSMKLNQNFSLPESPASQSVDEMLTEVPALITQAENSFNNAETSSASVNDTLNNVISQLNAGNAEAALSELQTAESQLSRLEQQARTANRQEDRLEAYDDILTQYIEEDWPALIKHLEGNIEQATSDLSTANRNALRLKVQIASATQERNTAFTNYNEASYALRRAEDHLSFAPSERRSFENGVDQIQEYHRDGNLSEYEQYSRIKDMITDSIPVLRTYHSNIKTGDQIRSNEEVGRIVTTTIPNKYNELTTTTLPQLISSLTVSNNLAERQLNVKQNQLDDLVEELEETEAEIERLTAGLSANAAQGQNAAQAMISLIQESMINGMQLSLQLAEYFQNSISQELESDISSYEEMIELYRSLAEQLQALE